MHRLLLALAVSIPISSCSAQPKPFAPSVAPAQNAIFSSTREVRGLSWNGKALWAATAGGVLRFSNEKWAKWTRQSGLPANETFAVSGDGTVRFPLATARFDGTKWQTKSAAAFQKAPLETKWRGKIVRATLGGLEMSGKKFALPAGSSGTHVSALMPLSNSLEVAIYGDGLYEFNGAKWTHDAHDVPVLAREITAMAGDAQTLWIGTRREGIWRRHIGKWTQFLHGEEPLAHNVQFLARFRQLVWASTLDDGLICRDGNSWRHVAPPTLSSSAPRQMWVWKDVLYVRHGTGIVDSFDGATWTKNALRTIPRPGVYALGGDESRLVASGWGGWAEFDGKTWTPHYDVPELKGVPVLGVMCDGDEVWLATQSRGAGVWNRATGALKWLDERAGLPDDWVTVLGKLNSKIYAGTFVGGLARLDGDRWFSFPELKGENVTSLCATPDGILAATRHGVYEVKGNTAKKLDFDWLDSENQALLSDERGVWIGARTSLNFCRMPSP